MKRSRYIGGVAHAVPGLRHALGISRRELAACSGVSEATIVRIESGIRARPANVIRVANAMLVLELYSTPKAALEDEPAALRVAS